MFRLATYGAATFGLTIVGIGSPMLFSGPQTFGLVLTVFGTSLLLVIGIVAAVQLLRRGALMKKPDDDDNSGTHVDSGGGPIGSVGQTGGVTNQIISPPANSGPVAFEFGPGRGVENNVIEFATVRGFPTVARFLSGKGNIIRHLDADAPLSGPRASRPPAQNRKARRAAERKSKKGR
jgi:hypothetical protein